MDINKKKIQTEVTSVINSNKHCDCMRETKLSYENMIIKTNEKQKSKNMEPYTLAD